MKTVIPTPYGNLRLSARRSHFVDDVILEIGGPIVMPNGDPTRGACISLSYCFDGVEGWVDVLPSGRRRELDAPLSATAREIEDIVRRWLSDHHNEVRAVILHSLELGLARDCRKLDRAIEAARRTVAESEGFLARVRNRL